MNPEEATDRLNLLEDFGEIVTITPRSGRATYSLAAIFNRGPRRVELLGEGITRIEIMGSDPWLLVRTEDVASEELKNLDRVDIPSEPTTPYRVMSLEPEEDDGLFFVVQLTEAV